MFLNFFEQLIRAIVEPCTVDELDELECDCHPAAPAPSLEADE